ncbi:hypothetical protein EJB05_49528 [Eragrostis curvula]|uniref:Uncharacterized protein n=1 Tax=Eragrostis curvula TaxID=38414 RepID=A0A5J9T4L1_9POAL|nr:hypothetical protein EJB05_49528 [Eragrostis curvula]
MRIFTKSEALPGCIMFATAPLDHEDEMHTCFDSICCTNETSFVPGANGNTSAPAEDENGNDGADVVEKEGEDESSNGTPSPAVGKRAKEKRPAAHGASPSGKKAKKTYRDGLITTTILTFYDKMERKEK